MFVSFTTKEEGDDSMRQDNSNLVFKEPKNFNLGTRFPINVTKYNNDGTFTGTFDFDRMSAVKKIIARQFL